MAIAREAINDRVVVISIDMVQRNAVVAGLDRAERLWREYFAVDGELAEERLCDVDRHLVQTRVLVILRHLLMLVVVRARDIDLTDSLRGVATVQLGKHTDL